VEPGRCPARPAVGPEQTGRVDPIIPLFGSIGATTEAVVAQTLNGRLLLTLNRKKDAAKVLRAALRHCRWKPNTNARGNRRPAPAGYRDVTTQGVRCGR
jgi:hypothetical protein